MLTIKIDEEGGIPYGKKKKVWHLLFVYKLIKSLHLAIFNALYGTVHFITDLVSVSIDKSMKAAVAY